MWDASSRTAPTWQYSSRLILLLLLAGTVLEGANGIALPRSDSAALLAGAPQQTGGGTQISVIGKLQLLAVDTRNGTDESHFLLVLPNTTMLGLQFQSPPPLTLLNHNVQVTGTLNVRGARRSLQVATIGLTSTTSAQIAPATISGNQPTLVILVTYNDVASTLHTSSYFDSDIFTGDRSLNLYYQENSFNLITGITGDVVGWATLPQPKSYYTTRCGGAVNDPCLADLRNDAVNTVTDSSIHFGSYTRLIIVVNSDLGCGCALAFVGQVIYQSTKDGPFYFSESFIPDDGWGATAGHGFGVIAHEYGHGLGLLHSGDSYDSLWDVMSGGTYALTGPVHTIGYQKVKMGWVSGTAIRTVAAGTYALNVVVNQLETTPPPGGVQVVNVMTSVSSRYYTVEVREHVGYDVGLPSVIGVIIHYVDDTLPDWNAKPVMPPSGTICTAPSCDSSGAAWQVGQTFIDSANGIRIVILGSTSTSFTVNVYPLASSISLDVSPNSTTLGQSVRLSGAITPSQASGTVVTLSYSSDGGSTWSVFITTQTNGTGGYSVAWSPPYSGTYQLKANWSGNTNYSGATSPTTSLTVTGTPPPQITVLVVGPSSASMGASATFDVLVTNPGTSLNTTLYLEITGPGGFEYFDTQPITVAGSSTARFQFDWQVPGPISSATYTVTVGLIPPKPTAIAQTQITVT